MAGVRPVAMRVPLAPCLVSLPWRGLGARVAPFRAEGFAALLLVQRLPSCLDSTLLPSRTPARAMPLATPATALSASCPAATAPVCSKAAPVLGRAYSWMAKSTATAPLDPWHAHAPTSSAARPPVATPHPPLAAEALRSDSSGACSRAPPGGTGSVNNMRGTSVAIPSLRTCPAATCPGASTAVCFLGEFWCGANSPC